MDRNWHLQKHWTECNIKQPPSFYFDQNIYASFISDPIAVKLRHESGCRNIMWSSDYPHSECQFPDSVSNILEWSSLDTGRQRKLLWENANRFFRQT